MQVVPNRTRALRTVLFALALVGGAASSQAQPHRAGVVTAVHGTATVTRGSLARPLSLKFRDDVFAHDRITTGEASHARILLGGAAVVSVRERSVVTITETPRLSTIDVGSGAVALSVAKERLRPGDALDIRTPNAVAGIRGTVIVAEVDADTTRFTLLTGKVEVRAAGASVTLLPLQALAVVGPGRPGAVRPVTPADARAVARRFRLPVTGAPKDANEWIAGDQVDRAAATLREPGARRVDPLDTVGPRGRRLDTDDKDKRDKEPRVRGITPPTVPAPAPPAISKGRAKKD
ncbi:MAG TPA: FecR domain-containing protein [Patescibacteria group bacterium]|nr:FecR domain-containing protein [Patescibacteria group bacterium]